MKRIFDELERLKGDSAESLNMGLLWRGFHSVPAESVEVGVAQGDVWFRIVEKDYSQRAHKHGDVFYSGIWTHNYMIPNNDIMYVQNY